MDVRELLPPDFPTLPQWLAMTDAERDAAYLRYLGDMRAFGERCMRELIAAYSPVRTGAKP